MELWRDDRSKSTVGCEEECMNIAQLIIVHVYTNRMVHDEHMPLQKMSILFTNGKHTRTKEIGEIRRTKSHPSHVTLMSYI